MAMSNTAGIREALELAMARIGCPPGDNADADIYHRLSRAIALLADMEREREQPVAWMNDSYPADDAFIFHSPTEPPNPFFPTPLYTHPSPTTADAKDAPVDVQGIIRAGDAMANRLKIMETGAGLQAVWSEITKPFRP